MNVDKRKKGRKDMDDKKLRLLIEKTEETIWEMKRIYNALAEFCEERGHKIVCSVSGMGATCEICGKDFGWWCPKSYDHCCHYGDESEYCIYCGEPDERK